MNGGGGYALRLPAGLREVRAQAEGYVPSPAETVDVLAGQTAQLDFSLLPECSLLASDAESGEPEGWTFIFPWAPSNTHSFSPTQAFTDSPSGDYTNGANNWMQLPAMDLSDISTPLLRFASRCDTEAGFDFGRVEYRIDGGSWVEAWRCYGSPTWSEVEVRDTEGLARHELEGLDFCYPGGESRRAFVERVQAAVGPSIAKQQISSGTPFDRIVSVPAIHRIISGTGINLIVATSCHNFVISGTS